MKTAEECPRCGRPMVAADAKKFLPKNAGVAEYVYRCGAGHKWTVKVTGDK